MDFNLENNFDVNVLNFGFCKIPGMNPLTPEQLKKKSIEINKEARLKSPEEIEKIMNSEY